MNCEGCKAETIVLDSRSTKGAIRRRRQCIVCEVRSTTYEVPETLYRAYIARDLAISRLRDAGAQIGTIIDILREDL